MPFYSSADGLPLHYTDTSGTLPPLLLVHGWGVGQQYFQRNIPALAQHFRVIAPDLRGHALSCKTPLNLHLPQLAQDIRTLLDTLELDHVLAIGWSMGTTVLYNYWSQFGRYRLRALGFIDMTPCLVVQPGWPHGVLGNMDWRGAMERPLALYRNRLEVAKAACLGCFQRAQVPSMEVYHWWVDQSMAASTEALSALWLSMASQDWRALVPTIDVPVLLAYGQKSVVYPTGVYSWLAEQLPDSQLVLFENSGHSPHFEEPEKFNQAVIGFAAGLA